MKSVRLLVAFLLLSTAALPQGRGWPKPPAPADPARSPLGNEPGLRAKVDTVQLQREARELSELANTVPAEVDRVSHGLLNKDLPEKLKRIEKLSKHLRSEIQP
jgi:hypothetical protein